MELKKKRLFIGIGVGVALYFVFRYGLKYVLPNKPISNTKNFANADGQNVGDFVAKQYDPTHANSDGSKGATWVGYQDSDVIGYWQKGFVSSGTQVAKV